MDDSNRNIHNRKQDHIQINLNEDVSSAITAGFEHYHIQHNPLPELDLNQIDTSRNFLGNSLKAPLLISSMTGGTKEALKINSHLAAAAEARGIALALGSARAALESKDAAATFQLRKWAPDIPIYANLGAVQLNYGIGPEDCKRVVEMAEANALILHLNSLQEALQPEGQADFYGLLGKIEKVCKMLPVPVIAKEVGWGIDAASAIRLVGAGVACIDVAGAGGTSWSEVEKHRNTDESRKRISGHFRKWGLPTTEAITQVCQALPKVPVIASGGLRSGLDLAKSLALGASMGGLAGIFLRAATQSDEAVVGVIDEIVLELRITMFASGAANLAAMRKVKIHKRN